MEWQYRFENGRFEDLKRLQEKISTLGKEGWEAISMTNHEGAYTVLLKRETADSEPPA